MKGIGQLTSNKVRPFKHGIFLLMFPILLGTLSCGRQEAKERKAAELYQTHCARCHVAPEPGQLTKELWSERVLPEMAARMGIREEGYDPMQGLAYEEMEILHKAGIFPFTPVIEPKDWELLKEYVLSRAPDTLTRQSAGMTYADQDRFSALPVALDEIPGSYFTFLDFDEDSGKLWAGDISGSLLEYDFRSNSSESLYKVEHAITDFTSKDTVAYITDVGILDPSELSTGRIVRVGAGVQEAMQEIFHRPVNTLVVDLDKDGIDEMVISEFGHRTGQLTLMRGLPSGGYERKILLTQPGTIRTLARDMDRDGKLDLVAITSQGDESITILYQKEDLRFSVDKAIRFSPIYGSSWFELLDFDNDGDTDIVTVNGDNADKTYIAKPYHGLRIHLNDGNNNFKESHFHPLNGATRFVADDFDQDGDQDFVVISTFPDYENAAELSLVYLETLDAANMEFKPFKFGESNLSRWFLLDKGDVDQDGDMDVILSAFTYVFTPVPQEFTKAWEENNTDLLILKNRLRETGQ